jgi:hypothetical protein
MISQIMRPGQVKILVLQESPGCGKTSELHRLAVHFSQNLPRYEVVLSEPAPIQLGRVEPEDVLERLLGNVLEGVGSPSAVLPTSSLSARISYVLDSLSKLNCPVLICLDNAEHAFSERGTLEAIWQHFLVQFAQANHQAVLVLASQEWPTGTFLAESQLVTTIDVPPLSRKEGGQFLQTLGIKNVPDDLLAQAVDAVGGLPVCLE